MIFFALSDVNIFCFPLSNKSQGHRNLFNSYWLWYSLNFYSFLCNKCFLIGSGIIESQTVGIIQISFHVCLFVEHILRIRSRGGEIFYNCKRLLEVYSSSWYDLAMSVVTLYILLFPTIGHKRGKSRSYHRKGGQIGMKFPKAAGKVQQTWKSPCWYL